VKHFTQRVATPSYHGLVTGLHTVLGDSMGIRNLFEPERLNRLTHLEAENARLRRMAADLSAHVMALRSAVGGTSRAHGDEYPARQLRVASRNTDKA
jgi:uncharacterized NAD-dependent epimerase/dehydratase family protein